MAGRLLDVQDEKDLENDCPLLGLDSVPLQPVADTLASSQVLILLDMKAAEVEAMLGAARRKLKRLNKHGLLAPLNGEEAMAIHIYTQESNIYRILNQVGWRAHASLSWPLCAAVARDVPFTLGEMTRE